jgi:hypothetical protein
MNLQKIFLTCILCGLLAACSAGETSTPTLISTGAPEVTPGEPTPTLVPSPTTVPTQAQGRVILVAPDTPGAPGGVSAGALGSALAGLANASGLAFETRPALTPDQIPAEARVVILLQAPADLSALAAAAPQAQFVTVAGGDLQAGGNLSVIRQLEEQRTFMAGFITTLIAPDWRAAGLLPDAPANLQDAFINGGRYWCGRCIPIYAPLVLFPLTGTQPAGTDAAGWQSTVQDLQANILEAVYISPAADSPDLRSALAAQDLILVGTQPPTADSKAAWAATLSFDPIPAIQKLWPDLVAGRGGQTEDASLSWTDVNEDVFTVGRQRLAQEALAGLLDGTISPFSVPAQ